MKKCVVVYNKHSGKKNNNDFINNFERLLKENGYKPEIIYSKYKAHIIEIVKNLPNEVSLVISIGGDGTFNEAMRGNFERKKKLLKNLIILMSNMN